MSFNMYVPTRVLFGAGQLNSLYEQKMPGKKAIIVISSGKSARTNGYLSRVEEQLHQAGVETVVFDKVQPNPLKATVMEGSVFARETGCDFVVALGGAAAALKTFFILALSSLMIFSLTACGNSNAVNSVSSPKPAAATVTDKDTAASAKTSEDKTANGKGKKILVAYFSHSGNTKRVAEQIHNLVGGDIIEIRTVTPYPTDYQESVEVAKREKETNARPALSTKVDNMAGYDVIFIGYPIWWHTAPMPIYTFLEAYDLSGKTVIPFCTSYNSDIAESMDAIKSLCPKANILEGLTANDASKIEPWLTRIGMR